MVDSISNVDLDAVRGKNSGVTGVQELQNGEPITYLVAGRAPHSATPELLQLLNSSPSAFGLVDPVKPGKDDSVLRIAALRVPPNHA
jgi:hypothetical protein